MSKNISTKELPTCRIARSEACNVVRRPSPKFRPEPFSYHQEIELEIDSLTNHGHGIGRIDGWVVLVRFALPGEKIRARVFRNFKNYSEADLVEILVPSPDRIAPKCPLFGACGGCQYQHLAYENQLMWKQRQVAELFQHMLGADFPVEPVIPSPKSYGYRSKITPHFQKPKDGEIAEIGFLRIDSRQRLIDVEACPIAMEAINHHLTSVRQAIRENAHRYRKGATLLLRADRETVHTDPKAMAIERVGNLQFEFPAGEFFQNNPFLLEAFASYGVQQAKGDGGIRFLIDAYCGSGLFALSAAREFEKVVGIEVSEASISWARRNATRNGIANAEFIEGMVESMFAGVAHLPGAASAVLLDPPRKGSDETFLRQVLEFAPARIVYVSCNPATQIRDLLHLLNGGYLIERVQPFDLFPQTKHLECVVTLAC